MLFEIAHELISVSKRISSFRYVGNMKTIWKIVQAAGSNLIWPKENIIAAIVVEFFVQTV